MKVFKQYRELAPGETFDDLKYSLIIGSEFYIKDGDKLKKYVIIPTIGNEDKVGQKYNSEYSNIWCVDCTLVTFKVILTFESNTDTTVPVYYTKESFVNGTPDETISLKANERKTTTINKPEIYRFGVSDYDPNTLKFKSANTAITFAGVKGTVLDGYRLFDRATNLKETDLTYLDTSKMTNIKCMFQLCTSLITPDVSKFDTSKVTNMGYMFYDCPKLTTLDVSNWDTSNVTDMYQMFTECQSLTTLDVSNWDTSNVTSMYGTFGGCNNLTTLDVSNWNTSNVMDMSYMFSGCNNLHLSDFEGFLNKDFLKVSNTNYMFGDCYNIIKNPTDSDYTTSINKIDLSNFSVIGEEMFINSYLHKWMSIKIGKNIKQISLIGDNDTYGEWMPACGVDHFEVEDNNLVYASEDKKLLISKDSKMLYDVAHNIEGILIVPEGIEKIRTGCGRSLSSTNIKNIKQQTDLEYDKLPDDYYLKSYKGVNTLDLPSTLTLIGDRVMQYTDQSSTDPVLKTIICRASEPPIVKGRFLSSRGFNNLTLKVPAESIDKYKAANWWKNFKDIQAISE